MRPRANLITGGSDLGIKVPDWVFPQHQHMGTRKYTADTIMYKHKLHIAHQHIAYQHKHTRVNKSLVLWLLLPAKWVKTSATRMRDTYDTHCR